MESNGVKKAREIRDEQPLTQEGVESMVVENGFKMHL